MASKLIKAYDESGKQFFRDIQAERRNRQHVSKHDENYSLPVSYINELYDLIDENEPLTLLQRIDLERESSKNFYSFVMQLQNIYDYQDIKTPWQLARTEVIMMSMNYRNSARECSLALDTSLHQFNENRAYALFQEKPLAGIVHDGRLSGLLALRENPDPKTLLTPAIDSIAFNRVKQTLKLAL
jgi:hypothetical protein